MIAICLNCKAGIEFHARRGAKLSDLPCLCGKKFSRVVLEIQPGTGLKIWTHKPTNRRFIKNLNVTGKPRDMQFSEL